MGIISLPHVVILLYEEFFIFLDPEAAVSLLGRLDMDAHMRVFAVFLLQLVLYVGGMVVSVGDAQVAWDTHVKLDGDAAADAARLKVVYVGHAIFHAGNAANLILHVVGETGFKKFAHCLAYQDEGHTHDEETHDYCGERVEDAPALTKEDGAANAYRRA